MNDVNALIDIAVTQDPAPKESGWDVDRIIFDLDSQLELLKSKADTVDLIVAAGSGLLCGVLDTLWVGGFDLRRGRDIASGKIEKIVKKVAHITGCKDDDINACVKHLERFHIPSDGNTPDFGGGLQHHLRDFSHHPTVGGLIFSILSQFTEEAYGTDTSGAFIHLAIPDASKAFIGNSIPEKIINGTIIWFLHLVSDISGSGSTAGLSGGTGIPGPILSLAKELSSMPLFRNIKVKDQALSVFISKLFNGTLLAKHDANGKIIRDSVLRFDLRAELGIAEELSRQAIPVIANECFVRFFFSVRSLMRELKSKHITSYESLKFVNWDAVKPVNSPTLSRMLTVATGVFTAVDVAEAIASQKCWVNINYIGVARFAIAISSEISWALKRRDIEKIKRFYETIDKNTFTNKDNETYKKMEFDMESNKFSLTPEQVVILYNMEYHKTVNDIQENTKLTSIKELKSQWLEEWKKIMETGFESFTQQSDVKLEWYSLIDLTEKTKSLDPSKTWYKLALLEAMLFTPYYPLSLEKDKQGKEVPSKKYNQLNNPINGFKTKGGDEFLSRYFTIPFYPASFISRLRSCYKKVLNELSEVLKTVIKTVTISAAALVICVFTAGVFAPQIAVALVGSNFAGLSGAALTSASLAYLGGGAVAVGGLGMAGGTLAIVGGGALIGIGVGAGAGGISYSIGLAGKQATIAQSAKLIVSVREIFLNEEHDLEYSNTVYEQYVNSIVKLEKDLVDLRIKADTASDEEKKNLKAAIKNGEESVKTMKIAMKSLRKFISSYETGASNV